MNRNQLFVNSLFKLALYRAK